MDEYLKETGAVLPQPNPAYRGAIQGEFEGIAYEVLEPAIKRGVRFPLVVCLEGDGNPAYAELQRLGIQHKYPMLLLAVKCPQAEQGSNGKPEANKVAGIIRKVLQEYPAQPRNVYVTGQGQGATDAWELASRHPDLFAAALPVNGVGVPAQSTALKDVPVWAFQGAHDPSVANARQMIEALKAAGSTVAKYTEYAENEQVLLDAVWRNPEVLEWLIAQVKPLGKPASKK